MCGRLLRVPRRPDRVRGLLRLAEHRPGPLRRLRKCLPCGESLLAGLLRGRVRSRGDRLRRLLRQPSVEFLPLRFLRFGMHRGSLLRDRELQMPGGVWELREPMHQSKHRPPALRGVRRGVRGGPGLQRRGMSNELRPRRDSVRKLVH